VTPRRASIIEQLLGIISWDGRKVARYRWNALEYENVLTAIVLQGLDFLPREHFLGAVFNELNGSPTAVRKKLLQQVEQVTISVFSGDFYLRPSQPTDQTKISVQPDGLLESADIFSLIEVKRIKDSSFQPEQLAREFVIVTREAKPRFPLLILVLGEEPPVRIQRNGKKSIRDAIMDKLEIVWNKTEGHPYTLSELEHMVDSTVAWITWRAIAQVVERQLSTFQTDSPSTRASVKRLANSVISAINGQSLI
jgi:hypothetical protein